MADSVFFRATQVTVNNGSALITVQTGDDVSLIRENSVLFIGDYAPVTVKRTFIGSGNVPTIELWNAWSFSSDSGRAALAVPTAANLDAAVAALRDAGADLSDFASNISQVPSANSVGQRTSTGAMRVANAQNSDDAVALGQTGTAYNKDVTTSHTDATEGRIQRVGDFGLGYTGFENGADLDIPKYSQGIGYRWVINPTNGPFGDRGAWVTEYTSYGTGIISQMALRQGQGANELAFRHSITEDWSLVYHTSNILGTVSQSGGVPTGAIMERGRNGSGEYVKYADGTLICTGRVTLIQLTSSALGVTLTFPASFVSSPIVTASTLSSEVSGTLTNSSYQSRNLSALVSAVTATGASPRIGGVGDTFDPTDEIGCSYIAIGRWI